MKQSYAPIADDFLELASDQRLEGIEQGGFYRSDDMGKTWTDIGSGLDKELPLDPHLIVPHPGDSNKIYLAHGDGVYLSDDRGANFRKISEGLGECKYISPLIVSDHKPSLLYTAGGKGTPPEWAKNPLGVDAGIFRSRDSGDTWQRLQNGLPEHLHGNVTAMAIDYQEGRTFLYMGTTDGEVFQSTDEGESWIKIIDNIPPIIKKTWAHSLLKK